MQKDRFANKGSRYFGKVLIACFFIGASFFLYSFFGVKATLKGGTHPQEQERVVIISTNSKPQAKYWQAFFDGKSESGCRHIVVFEDWDGGADNGLGTLYAFQKAESIAKEKYGIALKELLRGGGNISLFHCAGVGKRLYPLTASEYNNKSAIRLPSDGGDKTILEHVLDTTLTQVPAFPGRLSVYWGDQIFLASDPLPTPSSHAEVFAIVRDFPSQVEWKEKRLDQYGLIIIESESQSRLVEKTSYSGLYDIIEQQGPRSRLPRIGVSLGSFSISSEMLEALLDTFHDELAEKKGKLNTDYHFWMPLTWDKDLYTNFMVAKGYDHDEVEGIYDRMNTLKEKLEVCSQNPIFGVKDTGRETLWWDFGNLKSLYNNMVGMLSQGSVRGAQLCRLLNLEQYYHPESNSILINCDADQLAVKDSILLNVTGKSVEAHGAVVLNSTVEDLEADHSFLYNVKDCGLLSLGVGEVRSDVFYDDGREKISFYTHLQRDNKADWEEKLPKNTHSFDDVYRKNESLLTLIQ